MGKKRDLQVLRTIDGETRTVGSSSPPDFLRYFDFPIFSYYYYITMFRCCCWNWFVGGSDDDRCRDSDDFGIAELTRAAATETVTPPDCVPFRFSFPSFPLDSVQQQELLLNRNRQQQQQQKDSGRPVRTGSNLPYSCTIRLLERVLPLFLFFLRLLARDIHKRLKYLCPTGDGKRAANESSRIKHC